ncbi:MAG: DUF4105 domain-containing protein [Prevotella ruminicola]|uniref:DUF4105 domain-containing protein n=1 Tax=Xylanibacter ruminicola TaxID=839 RepID=A0A9D5P5Q7_XYLRU|nr:DUF4105 domain-containing protein [Xylanibacter ruminicola]
MVAKTKLARILFIFYILIQLKNISACKIIKKKRRNGFFFENISYFCIVKHLKMKIKSLLTTAILLSFSYITSIDAHSAPNTENGAFVSVESNIDPMDSVEVSLLTCSPHEEIYSLYGHSAIRWHQGDIDLVFNWGMFSFSKPYFALRFVFGLTDYELAAYPYERFWPYYQQWGSSVTEQVLNLTNDEKRTLQHLLSENLKEENRVYRYNFFYNNCSTKPRDVIEKSIEGQVVYEDKNDFQPTFREMVRECNRNHRWSKFGNDMLLGVKADLATTRQEQEFLPMNLMTDFAHAQIYKDGVYRRLVKEQRLLVAPGVQVIEQDFFLTPTEIAVLLLIISVCIALYEWKSSRVVKWWDVALMTVQGLVGIVLTVMIFSQHPTTSLNLNLLLFNPLPLLFIPAVIKGKRSLWTKLHLMMIILYALGGILQSYPESMWIVALCLLIRCKK